ncbi:MAG: hypothetical protein ABI548_27095 [Polyangiaceae bacterium]
MLSLGRALELGYKTDAHFTAYEAPSTHLHRLNIESINQGIEVTMTSVVFDIDGPDHAASDAWRSETRGKVDALNRVHPGVFFYETRGGARIVYRQAEPMILRTQDDAREWSRVYAVAVAYLGRRFGIVADPACSDWQRHYRLPRATRDEGGKPESWPMLGDPHEIGFLEIDAAPDDVNKAKGVSKAFRAPSVTFVPSDYCGDGLLAHLLRGRGALGRPGSRGGWICLCPNRLQHTANTDGSDSTVVYPPKVGAEIGVIVCKHGHCESIVNKDWLRFFNQSEIDRARATG